MTPLISAARGRDGDGRRVGAAALGTWALGASALGVWHLGWAAASGIGSLVASLFERADPALGVAHGAILMFVTLIPALFSGFGNLAVPGLGGRARTAFPALGWAGGGLASGSVVVAFASLGRADPSGPLLAAIGLAGAGLFASALDLTVTLLSGRGETRMAALPPLAVTTLVTGLLLTVLLPIAAASAAMLPASPSGRLADTLSLLGLPALCVLALPALGLAATVLGVEDGMAALALTGAVGGLAWSHVVLSRGGVPHPGSSDRLLAVSIALPLLAVLPGVVRRLARRDPWRDAGCLHAIGCLAMLVAGVATSGRSGLPWHGAFGFAGLFAIVAGVHALWLDAPRAGFVRAVGLLQFATLALGAGAMVAFAGGAHPWVARSGEAVSALSGLLLAGLVLRGVMLGGAMPANPIGGSGLGWNRSSRMANDG